MNVKVVLFDIDGTLLTTDGGAREAFARALSEAVGRPVHTGGYSFSGRTDPQIARDLLTASGVEDGALQAGVPEVIRLYLRYFEEALPRLKGARLLPGVRELLGRLEGREGVRTALLTGNVEAGARLKLGHFGLERFFEFAISAFGDDSADRYRLPALALARARRALRADLSGSQLILVGDSEHDVLCGREVGARSVAVGTGWTPVETLRALAPDALLDDLSNTEQALEAILAG